MSTKPSLSLMTVTGRSRPLQAAGPVAPRQAEMAETDPRLSLNIQLCTTPRPVRFNCQEVVWSRLTGLRFRIGRKSYYISCAEKRGHLIKGCVVKKLGEEQCERAWPITDLAGDDAQASCDGQRSTLSGRAVSE